MADHAQHHRVLPGADAGDRAGRLHHQALPGGDGLHHPAPRRHGPLQRVLQAPLRPHLRVLLRPGHRSCLNTMILFPKQELIRRIAWRCRT